MGYYIEVPKNKEKALQLVELHNAQLLPKCPVTFSEIPAGKALICVVDNGPFEAAALCYSESEFRAFTSPDYGPQRPRTWVLIDKALAYKLTNYKGE